MPRGQRADPRGTTDGGTVRHGEKGTGNRSSLEAPRPLRRQCKLCRLVEEFGEESSRHSAPFLSAIDRRRIANSLTISGDCTFWAAGKGWGTAAETSHHVGSICCFFRLFVDVLEEGGNGLRDKALAFGPQEELFGVLTTPDEVQADLPAVVMPNAGLLHHVGPHRLHVDLARRLAASGSTSLRFDLSGIGESGSGGGALHTERSMRDLQAAMDAVEHETGIARFVIVGLCAGAFYARRVATEDERVVGCVLIDGYACPTPKYHVRRYADFALHFNRWARFALRRRRRKANSPIDESAQLVPYQFEEVTREDFAADLETLLARQMDLLFVYTGGGPQPFNYLGQLEDAFPELDLTSATVRMFRSADHTFSLGVHRTELMNAISDWLGSRFDRVVVS